MATELKALGLVVVPEAANEETTQWTWNTLGLVINDKATFTTFICDFVFLFLLRFHHRTSEEGIHNKSTQSNFVFFII